MRGCGLLVMGAILQQGRRNREVEGGGDLERPSIAVDDEHVPPDSLNERGIVGGAAPVGVSMLKHLTQETLWGLYAAQRLAIGGRLDATFGVDHLDGVGNSQAWHNGGVARANGMDHPGEQLRRCQAAGGVMNQDDAVVDVKRSDPSLHRRGPIGTPGHDVHAGVITGDFPSLPKVGGGCNNDHMSDLGTTQDAPQCMSK